MIDCYIAARSSVQGELYPELQMRTIQPFSIQPIMVYRVIFDYGLVKEVRMGVQFLFITTSL